MLSDLTIYTLVENVRSLHNVGSIFRTADGAGVAKIFLCGITGKPPHRDIRKAALGAEEAVPWEYRPGGLAVVEQLQQQDVQIVVLESKAENCFYDEAPYRFPLCLVVGHERRGVSEEILARADLAIRIPMAGIKSSLNVAVAYGVALYEIAKRRNQLRG